MRGTGWFAMLCLLLWPGAALAQDLDGALAQLGEALSAQIERCHLHRVGVPEFMNAGGRLGGDTGAAGYYVAEKVEEGLVKAARGSYEVVERRRLNAVLQEAQIQAAGLTDEESSQELLGRIKGLDCLIVGSLTRAGKTLKVTSKVVRLPDAVNVAAESVSIPLDPDLLSLFGENAYVSSPLPEREEVVNAALGPASGPGNGCPYGLEVLVDGRPKPRYRRGDDLYVAASAGEVYQIRVSNRSGGSVAVALFVDGLNTIGQKRELASTGRKWVLRPGQTAVIRGWQMDTQHARQFVFVGLEESLAARQRFSDQIGLITAAFYPEAGTEEELRGLLGTGEGARVDSPVREVDFRAAGTPAAILALRYDAAEIVQTYEPAAW